MLDQARQLLNDAFEKPRIAPRYEGEGEASSARGSWAAPTPLAQPTPAQQPAATPGAPVGSVIPGRRRALNLPPLEVKFGGNPKDLGFFLAQVWSYMEEYEGEFTSEAAKVRCVTRALEGIAAEWMVTLYNDNSPQLQNLNVFMTALRRRFEDLLAERKARIRMKTINQGGSEKASDEPHRSTDCSIEILPGVMLPKPKLYSMTPWELEELRSFIDENLKRGFIQPARPRVA
uniref:DUF4939 domain-containing protein n=1 Tax=Pseudonaja textilis TaxID=8673 RepID=A0A670ZE00_PSETE